MSSWPSNMNINRLTSWLNRYARFVVIGMLLAFFVVSLVLSRQDSIIMDEQAHIPAAYSYVAYGEMRLNPEHPPLIKDLAGLSLLITRPNFPVTDKTWTSGNNEQWTLGQLFLFASGNNPDLIAFWSRLPIILLALLLGWFIYRWTSELAGKMAGLFALLLYVCDPNIIAHSHYVTTDIGIAAAVFISTYYFIRWLKKPTLKNVMIAGLVLGLAELTKFSAVLLWPLYACLALIYAWFSTDSAKDQFLNWRLTWRRILAYVGKYVGLVAICGLVIWAVYALNTWNMPAEKIREPAAVSLADQGWSKTAEQIISAISPFPLLKPIGVYMLGAFMVHDRVQWGSTVFFLGQVTSGGSHNYFPVVILIKETIPFLLLLVFAFVFACQNTVRAIRHRTLRLLEIVGHSIRDHIAQYTMAAFVVVYAFFSIKENLNIGFRHLFPILPFLYVLAACAVASFIRRRLATVRQATTWIVLGAVVVWIVAIPIFAYPNYISYFNETIGGHRQGYQYVTDSNYDWGQDLKRLQMWVKNYNTCAADSAPTECLSDKLKLSADSLARIDPPQPIDAMRVVYFGGDDPRYRLGDIFQKSNSFDAPATGWHAISLEFYQESVHKAQQFGVWDYRWLANILPIGRAGDSILIFYVTPEDVANAISK